MKKLFAMLLVCGALLFGSCTVHTMHANNHNLNQTQVVLTKNNFKVIGTIEGHATATMVFGIGGCSAKAVRNSAIHAMYNKANLRGAQTIINVNVKKSVGGVPPFYTRSTWVATGTIIEFID